MKNEFLREIRDNLSFSHHHETQKMLFENMGISIGQDPTHAASQIALLAEEVTQEDTSGTVPCLVAAPAV